MLPDKYESGSHNMIGIAGLAASVEWILNQGVSTLHAHEQLLCEKFINEMKKCSCATIIGPPTIKHRCGVFSLDFQENPHEIAWRLEESSSIQSRSGLHCAPFAHQAMGTSDRGGTVRVSFSPFHTSNDILFLTEAIKNITQKALT